MSKDTKVNTHPSYGMARFSRRQHGGAGRVPLFGSAISQHLSTISLTICRASEETDFGERRHYPEENLIEVEFSAAQFAELLTTMNVHSGAACTIRYIGGEQIEDPPAQTPLHTEVGAELESRFVQRISRVNELIAKVEEQLTSGKPLGKKAQEELLWSLKGVRGQFVTDTPFYLDQFKRVTAKTMAAAKAEFDAFMTAAVTSLGLEALKSRLSSDETFLLESEDEPEQNS